MGDGSGLFGRSLWKDVFLPVIKDANRSNDFFLDSVFSTVGESEGVAGGDSGDLISSWSSCLCRNEEDLCGTDRITRLGLALLAAAAALEAYAEFSSAIFSKAGIKLVSMSCDWRCCDRRLGLKGNSGNFGAVSTLMSIAKSISNKLIISFARFWDTTLEVIPVSLVQLSLFLFPPNPLFLLACLAVSSFAAAAAAAASTTGLAGSGFSVSGDGARVGISLLIDSFERVALGCENIVEVDESTELVLDWQDSCSCSCNWDCCCCSSSCEGNMVGGSGRSCSSSATQRSSPCPSSSSSNISSS